MESLKFKRFNNATILLLQQYSAVTVVCGRVFNRVVQVPYNNVPDDSSPLVNHESIHRHTSSDYLNFSLYWNFSVWYLVASRIPFNTPWDAPRHCRVDKDHRSRESSFSRCLAVDRRVTQPVHLPMLRLAPNFTQRQRTAVNDCDTMAPPDNTIFARN